MGEGSSEGDKELPPQVPGSVGGGTDLCKAIPCCRRSRVLSVLAQRLRPHPGAQVCGVPREGREGVSCLPLSCFLCSVQAEHVHLSPLPPAHLSLECPHHHRHLHLGRRTARLLGRLLSPQGERPGRPTTSPRADGQAFTICALIVDVHMPVSVASVSTCIKFQR